MIKKTLALLMATLMVGSFTACSGASDTESSSGSEASSESSSESSEDDDPETARYYFDENGKLAGLKHIKGDYYYTTMILDLNEDVSDSDFDYPSEYELVESEESSDESSAESSAEASESTSSAQSSEAAESSETESSAEVSESSSYTISDLTIPDGSGTLLKAGLQEFFDSMDTDVYCLKYSVEYYTSGTDGEVVKGTNTVKRSGDKISSSMESESSGTTLQIVKDSKIYEVDDENKTVTWSETSENLAANFTVYTASIFYISPLELCGSGTETVDGVEYDYEEYKEPEDESSNEASDSDEVETARYYFDENGKLVGLKHINGDYYYTTMILELSEDVSESDFEYPSEYTLVESEESSAESSAESSSELSLDISDESSEASSYSVSDFEIPEGSGTLLKSALQEFFNAMDNDVYLIKYSVEYYTSDTDGEVVKGTNTVKRDGDKVSSLMEADGYDASLQIVKGNKIYEVDDEDKTVIWADVSDDLIESFTAYTASVFYISSLELCGSGTETIDGVEYSYEEYKEPEDESSAEASAS